MLIFTFLEALILPHFWVKGIKPFVLNSHSVWINVLSVMIRALKVLDFNKKNNSEG